MTIQIDIWSDIACPWCYVGKRRLEAALREFPQDVDVTWHSFELDPAAPKQLTNDVPYVDRLAKKYGRTAAQAQQMIDGMKTTAAADGLDMDFENIQPGSTFDAHRLLHLAKREGKQDELKERLFKAYLCEGALMSDHATLTRLATDVGLQADTVDAVLSSDLYADQVRGDEDAARKLGVSGVPFYVIAQRFGVSGAQPAEAFVNVLQRAAEEQPKLEFAEGAACGPDGC